MRKLLSFVYLLLIASTALAQEPKCEFQISFTRTVSDKPFTGRVLVMLGNVGSEPRLGPNWFGPSPFYAKDVKNWNPGEPLTFGIDAISYPMAMNKLAAREYAIQAVLDLDQSSSHRIGSAPGNGYSPAAKAVLDPAKGFSVNLVIDQLVKEAPFRETDRIKLVEIESRLLTQFHGKPMKLRAGVKLPKSFTEKPDQKYPVIFEIPGFGGNHRSVGRDPLTAHSPVEMLYVVLDPDCRTGHHVFADSVNNGPYGKALIDELIPEIENDTVVWVSQRLVS